MVELHRSTQQLKTRNHCNHLQRNALDFQRLDKIHPSLIESVVSILEFSSYILHGVDQRKDHVLELDAAPAIPVADKCVEM